MRSVVENFFGNSGVGRLCLVSKSTLQTTPEMAVYILRAAYQIVGALDNSLRK
jgi:hypothetical protein